MAAKKESKAPKAVKDTKKKALKEAKATKKAPKPMLDDDMDEDIETRGRHVLISL